MERNQTEKTHQMSFGKKICCLTQQKCSTAFSMLLTAVFLFVGIGLYAGSTPVKARYVRVETQTASGWMDLSEVASKEIDTITVVNDPYNFFFTSLKVSTFIKKESNIKNIKEKL